MDDSPHMTPAELRRHGRAVVDWIADYCERIETYPVFSQVAPGEVRAALPPHPPETGEDFNAILADARARSCRGSHTGSHRASSPTSPPMSPVRPFWAISWRRGSGCKACSVLFSANTQVNVYLSMDAGKLFKLDSVQLKIDDKVVSNYLYTDRELKALSRGGVQGLYIGNMSAGEHEITALMTGTGPNQQDYKRGVTQKVEKTDEALYIEIKIIDNTAKEQPDFELKVWE